MQNGQGGVDILNRKVCEVGCTNKYHERNVLFYGILSCSVLMIGAALLCLFAVFFLTLLFYSVLICSPVFCYMLVKFSLVTPSTVLLSSFMLCTLLYCPVLSLSLIAMSYFFFWGRGEGLFVSDVSVYFWNQHKNPIFPPINMTNFKEFSFRHRRASFQIFDTN